MKHFKLQTLLLAGVLGLALNAVAQPTDETENNPPAQDETPVMPVDEVLTPVNDETVQTAPDVQSLLEAVSNSQPASATSPQPPESFVKQGTTPPRFVAPMKGTNGLSEPSPFDSNTLSTNSTPPDQVVKDGEKGLRLNFRNAPLDMVLSYLSDAAGFIIVPETDVSGKVTVWSNQPLTKDEAVQLLSKVLADEGYAVLRDGRTLTIVTQSAAKTRNIPVEVGYEPSTIPITQQVVTQIIPVRFINAVQLAKDLQPLMPAQTTMTANEGGNALVITDTQEHIHRMAEIIKALDTSVSSLSSVRVFTLKYADAKTVADMIKDVFASTETSSSSGGRSRGPFRFGGPFGGGGGDNNNSSNTGRPGASRVVATSDDRSNALVVSAPEDLMPTIAQLVTSVDVDVTDLTEIRVFRLQNADPQETADMLANLFPDTSSSQNQQGGFRSFFRSRFGGGSSNNNNSNESERMKKQSKVIAVPDPRTRSVVVTASRDTMDQIAKVIADLDADPAQKQKVFVYEVQNTDPTTVQETLQDLFSGQSTATSRSRATTSGQVGTQLSTRAQRQNQTSNTRNNTGYGGTSTSGTRSFGN